SWFRRCRTRGFQASRRRPAGTVRPQLQRHQTLGEIAPRIAKALQAGDPSPPGLPLILWYDWRIDAFRRNVSQATQSLGRPRPIFAGSRAMRQALAPSAIRMCDDVRSSPRSHATPIVFVVDDNVSVRKSLESLIHDAGWQPETFESAWAFLSRP